VPIDHLFFYTQIERKEKNGAQKMFYKSFFGMHVNVSQITIIGTGLLQKKNNDKKLKFFNLTNAL
jgi:hypothetical protein